MAISSPLLFNGRASIRASYFRWTFPDVAHPLGHTTIEFRHRKVTVKPTKLLNWSHRGRVNKRVSGPKTRLFHFFCRNRRASPVNPIEAA
jgi:hypothetical protein